MSISKEDFAARLNGREIGAEISGEERQEAKGAGLLVIYGYSDDNVEFEGLFLDEVIADNGAFGEEIKFTRYGILAQWEDAKQDEASALKYFEAKKTAKTITAFFGRPSDEYSWTFTTDLPHATFDIMEDGEKFCRGIVISAEDLK